MHAAWDLINEPRSDLPSGPSDVQSWITEVAPYVKSLAPNQLVTVGEDGFYQKDNCQSDGCGRGRGLWRLPRWLGMHAWLPCCPSLQHHTA